MTVCNFLFDPKVLIVCPTLFLNFVTVSFDAVLILHYLMVHCQ